MNEIEQAMFNALFKIDQGSVINEDSYMMLDESIGKLNKHLFIVWWKQVWRDNEARKNKKAISTTKLNCVVFKKLDELRKKEADPFYFPSLITFDKDMMELYFCDETAFQFIRESDLLKLKIILPPELTLENIPDIRKYVLTIKKLFSLMSQNIDTPLLKVHIDFMVILQAIQSITINTHRKMMQEELQQQEFSAKQSKVAATKTPATLQKIQSHSLYSEIKKIISSDNKPTKKNSKIKRMILQMEIEGATTEKTADKYRKLIQEMENARHLP